MGKTPDDQLWLPYTSMDTYTHQNSNTKVNLTKNHYSHMQNVYPDPLASLWPMQIGMQSDISLFDFGSCQERVSRGSWELYWVLEKTAWMIFWVACIEYSVKTGFSPITFTGHENKYYLLPSKNSLGHRAWMIPLPSMSKERIADSCWGGGDFCGLFIIVQHSSTPKRMLSGVLKPQIAFYLWREFTVSYAIM